MVRPVPTDAPLKVYRHELKFFLSPMEHRLLLEIFSQTMRLDAHAGPDKHYWIRSLYFDTVENDDYYEKVIGVSTRKKIRLRIYDRGQNSVKLEIKNRRNQYMMKETAFLTREEAERLIRGERGFLLQKGHPALSRVFYLMTMNCYRPAVLIDYRRTAFLIPFQNIRVTFDTDLRASTSDFDLFSHTTGLVPVFDTDTVVLEVKYHKFLPPTIRSVLSHCHASRQAISKYCLSRIVF